jgi:hypothetical protein
LEHNLLSAKNTKYESASSLPGIWLSSHVHDGGDDDAIGGGVEAIDDSRGSGEVGSVCKFHPFAAMPWAAQ